MEFIEENIQIYSEQHTEEESLLLKELSRETHAKILKSRMISGHLQGRILSMFSKLVQPKHILEIGTYTGYSAICMAEGLPEDGKLFTIDINEELSDLANTFFIKSGNADKIKILTGNALEIIPTLDYSWDLVFIDADKENYSKYFDLVIESVRPGGIIIADNVLWSGKVISKVESNDKDTIALIHFNEMVHEDVRVENLLLPVRDGLMILRKV
jgi:caffeoyl-CoA O-methyltransferase